MRFLFVILPIFCFSQNTITVNISMDTAANIPNPKVRVYQNGALVNTFTYLKVPHVYTYQQVNATYAFEPYFDSIPASMVDTADWRSVASEAMYVDAPSGQRGLFLNSAQKFWGADVKEIKKLDMGQAYKILKKNYLSTVSRFTQSNLQYTVYSTHNRNGSTTQYGSYANSASDFDVMFNTANSNTVVHSSGTASPNVLFYFTSASTLVANGVPVPNNYDFYGIKITGTFIAKETGIYYFAIDGDDGVDCLIDGQVVTSFYGPHGFGGFRIGAKQMVAGTAYSLMVRMQEFGGGDGLSFAWRRPSQNSYSIQPEEIATASSSYYGPKVDWFKKETLDALTINNWGTAVPQTRFFLPVASGQYTLNLKYVVKGNAALSSPQ
jgi:hypothetical protein